MKLECGFAVINGKHCLSEDGTHCIVCNIKILGDSESGLLGMVTCNGYSTREAAAQISQCAFKSSEFCQCWLIP